MSHMAIAEPMVSRIDIKNIGFGQKDTHIICSALHRYVSQAERLKVTNQVERKSSIPYSQTLWAMHWKVNDAINTLKVLCDKKCSNEKLFGSAIKKGKR